MKMNRIQINRVSALRAGLFKRSEIRSGDLVDVGSSFRRHFSQRSRYQRLTRATVIRTGCIVASGCVARRNEKKGKPSRSLSLVEPEGPRRLQRNAGVLIPLDRADGLVRQHRRFQQVLLRFAFRRGHIRNERCSSATTQRQKSCDVRRRCRRR